MAEKAAETEEAIAKVTAETVDKNIIEEVAETEIITVKAAETEEVVKSVENFWDFCFLFFMIKKTWS